MFTLKDGGISCMAVMLVTLSNIKTKYVKMKNRHHKNNIPNIYLHNHNNELNLFFLLKKITKKENTYFWDAGMFFFY